MSIFNFFKSTIITSVLSSIISEKRTEFRNKSHIIIDFFINSSNYALFSNIEVGEFKRVISNLINNKIQVHILTGDNEKTAVSVASKLGIVNYMAECLPKDKADYIKDLQNKGRCVAMVGDGINDSLALAQADVSIAMGQGTDIAMDVAKMTIISSDLRKIAYAISLSSVTFLFAE